MATYTTPDYRYERLGGVGHNGILIRRVNKWNLFLKADEETGISAVVADDFLGTEIEDDVVTRTVTYAPTGGMMLRPPRPREKKRDKVFKDEEVRATVVLVAATRDELPTDTAGAAGLRVAAAMETSAAPSPGWGAHGSVRLTGTIRSAEQRDRQRPTGRITMVLGGRSVDDDEAMALIIAALEE